MRLLTIAFALLGLTGAAKADPALRSATAAAKAIAVGMPTTMWHYPGTLKAQSHSNGTIVVTSPIQGGVTTRTFQSSGWNRVKLMSTSVEIKTAN